MGTRSLFAIPLNAWHQIVNASSSSALLLAATTAPNVVNIIRDVDFVMSCPNSSSTALTDPGILRRLKMFSPIRYAVLPCAAPIPSPIFLVASYHANRVI